MRTRLEEGTTTILPAFLCLAALSLSSCTGAQTAEHIADMPHWMGGLPGDAPPRHGTSEWAQEAAKPKTEQQQPK